MNKFFWVLLQWTFFLIFFVSSGIYAKYNFRIRKIKEGKSSQQIDISYPVFYRSPTLSRAIQNDVLKLLRWHREQAREDKNGRLDLSINFEIIQNNRHYISLVMNISEYTGGAHGNFYNECYNYDIIRKRYVSIEDLFNLETLSIKCKEKLIADYNLEDDDWLRKGVAAHNDNFCKFTFTKDTVTIYFQLYQVCCYAEGAPQISLER